MLRPVVILGEDLPDAAHQLLYERFALTHTTADRLADLIEAERWEVVGLVAGNADAKAALKAAETLGEKIGALVLVSPSGLLDDAEAETLGRAARCPKAVLMGTSDAGMPAGAAARFRKVLPRSNVVLVFGAGADVAADRPDAFASAAGDFLDRQGRFGFMTESVAVRR